MINRGGPCTVYLLRMMNGSRSHMSSTCLDRKSMRRKQYYMYNICVIGKYFFILQYVLADVRLGVTRTCGGQCTYLTLVYSARHITTYVKAFLYVAHRMSSTASVERQSMLRKHSKIIIKIFILYFYYINIIIVKYNEKYTILK